MVNEMRIIVEPSPKAESKADEVIDIRRVDDDTYCHSCKNGVDILRFECGEISSGRIFIYWCPCGAKWVREGANKRDNLCNGIHDEQWEKIVANR